MFTPLLLDAGEDAYSDLPLTYSRFYGMNVEYQQTTGLFLGSPLFMAAGYAATAVGNSMARNRAAAQAAPQWREHCLARTVVTNVRTRCLVNGQWIGFDHAAVVEFTADLPNAACVMTFNGVEPLCLNGIGAPWLAVLLSYFLHGHERLGGLPYLHPLQ